MEIVLVEPEIPPNTGNVARTCVLTGSPLHLVKPLGFSLEDKYLRRSGLDYWHHLNLRVHENYRSFRKSCPGKRLIFFTTRGKKYYHEIEYGIDDMIVFGSETRGLGEEVLAGEKDLIRVPMINGITRSLNLGNTVALVLYEALRQQGFPGMV